MNRKALLLTVVIAISAIVTFTSNVATAANTKSVNLCVAYDLGGPGDRSYNDAVLAGLTKAKKTLNFTFEGSKPREIERIIESPKDKKKEKEKEKELVIFI